MSIAIVWFRRDFRLHDNGALRAALDSADAVIPVYIHAPEEAGDWAPGAASNWWRHRSLEALRDALRSMGSELVIRPAKDSLHEMEKLVEETGATAVHWNRLYEPAFANRDAKMKTRLGERGIEAASHAGCLLHEPTRLRTKQGSPFKVFTPFWKALLPGLDVPRPLEKPRELKAPARFPSCLELETLGLAPTLDWASGFSDAWTPGEAGGLQRLEDFLESGLKDYAKGRDFPGEENVSRLSPHLHFGEITPRQAWHAVQSAKGPENAKEAYLRELGWREFSHHVLFHFPHTPDAALYEKYAHFPWRGNYEILLQAWQRGMTGYPIVDAGMRQLWQTGWMHNRVRMIVASLLVKNLRIPWQEGARWFWDTLVDADLANNTMGWQWSAGCGADAAPYFRIFNPFTQSAKFDCTNYIRRYLPELARLPDRYVHDPSSLPEKLQEETGFVPGRDYPLPIVEYRASREQALAALASLKKAGN